MLNQLNYKSNKNYKLINFRTVKDLITAEFLHDLYNQHRHQVNSIRFRNTICILRGHDFRSYAPQHEWDFLGAELGRRLFKRDALLLSEINKYILLDKKTLLDFIELVYKEIDSASLEKLYEFLSTLHYLALGEIYGINLVQIEHGLTWAISQYLQGNSQDFSSLSNFNWDSKFQEYEEFLIRSSLLISKKEHTYDDFLLEHNKLYSNFSNGYGSGISEDHDIKKRMEKLLEKSVPLREKQLASLDREPIAIPQSSEYSDLYTLASRIAELRDRNKFLMGKVAALREILLSHIASKTMISREDLSRYSLYDINRLIVENKVVSPSLITERSKLVVFKREEYFCSETQAESLSRLFISDISRPKNAAPNEPIYGTIASKGIVRGRVKIVIDSSDCAKVGKQDILVAFGTDFDLMQGIAACAGVITEEGGTLSHASVITRELQKPCLINVPNVMSLLKEDDNILLDCQKGYFVIEGPSQRKKTPFSSLDDFLGQEFGQKIANLSFLKKHNYNVLPGICFSTLDRINIKNKKFFIELNRLINEYFYTNNIIIRSSSLLEDQSEFSYAGLFRSRAINADIASLTDAFQEVCEKVAHLKNYDKEIKKQKNAVLIQPYVPFLLGGITFTNLYQRTDKKVIVEASFSQGSFGAVNGMVESRTIFPLEELKDEMNQSSFKSDSEYFMKKAACIAKDISHLFGFDIDMEWGVYNNEVWILQSRKVTKPC